VLGETDAAFGVLERAEAELASLAFIGMPGSTRSGRTRDSRRFRPDGTAARRLKPPSPAFVEPEGDLRP
jgi:hypothetical protein